MFGYIEPSPYNEDFLKCKVAKLIFDKCFKKKFRKYIFN